MGCSPFIPIAFTVYDNGISIPVIPFDADWPSWYGTSWERNVASSRRSVVYKLIMPTEI
jgi:hypothetical protein